MSEIIIDSFIFNEPGKKPRLNYVSVSIIFENCTFLETTRRLFLQIQQASKFISFELEALWLLPWYQLSDWHLVNGVLFLDNHDRVI